MPGYKPLGFDRVRAFIFAARRLHFYHFQCFSKQNTRRRLLALLWGILMFIYGSFRVEAGIFLRLRRFRFLCHYIDI